MWNTNSYEDFKSYIDTFLSKYKTKVVPTRIEDDFYITIMTYRDDDRSGTDVLKIVCYYLSHVGAGCYEKSIKSNVIFELPKTDTDIGYGVVLISKCDTRDKLWVLFETKHTNKTKDISTSKLYLAILELSSGGDGTDIELMVCSELFPKITKNSGRLTLALSKIEETEADIDSIAITYIDDRDTTHLVNAKHIDWESDMDLDYVLD